MILAFVTAIAVLALVRNNTVVSECGMVSAFYYHPIAITASGIEYLQPPQLLFLNCGGRGIRNKAARTSLFEYDKAHTFSPTERITEHRNKNHSSISAGRLFSQPCSVPITSLSLLRGGAKEGGNEVHKKVITSQKNPPLWKTKQNKNHSIIETNDNNSTLCRNQINSKSTRSKQRMYLACAAIVLLWISTGTIFYSLYNNWPLAQSFFYAVDAGMSIGFCTDVAETKIGSRAFTIIFILLGASSVGGALALFIQDIMEGAVELRNCEFELILAKDAFVKVDGDCDGKIQYNDFRILIQEWTDREFTNDEFESVCRKFDPSQCNHVTSTMFLNKITDMHKLLQFDGPLYSNNIIVRKGTELKEAISKPFSGHNRIFAACLAWVTMGILWGKHRMKWDIITATHFAISALATGGLTGPPVNRDGILPLEPAVFCGVFCLIGIPLFAITLAHFARALVESHVVAQEKKAIFRPLNKKEFDYAKSLCSPEDQMVHLSDFIVLQLLRMGKVDMCTINLIKTQFKILDVDGSGKLLQSTKMQQYNTTFQE